jgi:hypothetical protein
MRVDKTVPLNLGVRVFAGSRRGPSFAGYQCLSGKCAYNCDFCFNCDGA